MALSSLSAFALALVVMAGMPGPSVAALVARVLTSGFRDVLPFLAAMWIGEAVWLTCAVAGLAALAHTFALGFLVLKFLGVAYLLFLAWKMWFAPAELQADSLPGKRSPVRMFFAGLSVALGNPKIMIFYMALLPTMVDLSRVGVLAWSELVLTMLAVLIATDLAWVLFATRARRLLTSRRMVRAANRSSAIAMAGAAVTIAAR
ncbi:Homoserine/homoserine lactone efflux protein [Paraburkholderia caffeinitolerans]|uniref:Homoserine/homoserine lactone efflux protein n=1 Tax=Paraburkholderia caffeinitolerans TaxID=1723730 RepID=A0A6J5H047_9BURK|nr:LysE family translocator [Paraburkholderia caffeinitolerans]CAB3809849.1 Homoserine/homoserine lactone efflux protein [Paraburkholderia caffeinitolerans]